MSSSLAKRARSEEAVKVEKPMPSSSSSPCRVAGENCVVCEESLTPCLFFPLPLQYAELKRWTLGFFPHRPEEFEMFIEHIRSLDDNILPVVCISHFESIDIVGSPGAPVLRPCAVPMKYNGSMRSRMDRIWESRKCIVCGAFKSCDAMHPFTQKAPQVSIWCKHLFPGDKKAANRMYTKVMRAVCPALCTEHFGANCFDVNGDLRPHSIPSVAKLSMESNVLSLLSKAKADLNKVLPGDFIPRNETWSEVDRAAGYTEEKFVARKPKQWQENPNKKRKKSIDPVPNDLFLGHVAAEVKEETKPRDYLMDLADELLRNDVKEEELIGLTDDDTDSNLTPAKDPVPKSVDNVVGPVKEKRTYKKRPVFDPSDVRTSQRLRTKKATPPPTTPDVRSRRTRETAETCTTQDEGAVVTRSGRQVKRKDLDFSGDMERRPWKGKRKAARPSSSLSDHDHPTSSAIPGTVDPITGEIYEEPMEDQKPDLYSVSVGRFAAAKTAIAAANAAAVAPASSKYTPVAGCSKTPPLPTSVSRSGRARLPAPKIAANQQQGEEKAKRARSKPFKHDAPPQVKCESCNASADATLFGMKEHAREHTQDSLKCPFQPCSFTSTKRSKISHHTQNEHRRWALPIDLCEFDHSLENTINGIMHKCFPVAMIQAKEPGSVACTICSLVVSPKYHALYSHASIHLPSRPYLCSACNIDAYTEEAIEEHLQEQQCGGDVVTNVDDAIASLVEKIFKTAFPTYAHLIESAPPVLEPQVAPPLTGIRFVPASTSQLSNRQLPMKIEDEHVDLLEDLGGPHFSDEHKQSSAFKAVEHDHNYCQPPLLNQDVLKDLLDSTDFNIDDIARSVM